MTNKPFGLNANGYDSKNDQYAEFEIAMKERFAEFMENGDTLYKTNADDLYALYLAELPEEARQTYVCNACRHFINRFGNLVTLSPEGLMTSVLWIEDEVPAFFAPAVFAMEQAVLNSKITTVFLADQPNLGTPKTGDWTHLSVRLPVSSVFTDRILTPGQAMAQKREDYQMLIRALNDFSLETVNQALALIETESLYRSDKVYGHAKWFKELIEKRNIAEHPRQKSNIVWHAVAHAPAGFTHIRSSVIGTLLDDINAGLSARMIAARFAEKLDPANYMRSQSAPSQNAIAEAEKVVAKLGLETALLRRYAAFEELPHFEWQDRTIDSLAVPEEKSGAGVFGHLRAKDQVTVPNIDLPVTVMTWEKFTRTVLYAATGIEVLTDNANRFMALVTAADENAQNILQWDNPFSWYYHGGVDGEIKRRVEAAGGRYENNEIRASLIWEGYTDLDLHAYTPTGSHISFSDKRDRYSSGYLDIDANGGSPTSLTPVENIRWANGAPEGEYRFIVHNYAERGKGTTPFKVELEVNGKVFTYHGIAGSTNYQEEVFKFVYVKGQEPRMISSRQSFQTTDAWGVKPNEFVKVNGITTSPNLWGSNPVEQAGTHIFFLLDGVQDSSEGKGRGFFNEMLKSDLRPIRKTLELFAADAKIYDADQATACGVGYSKDSEWNLTLKVISGKSSRIIKIDRWD